MDTAKEIGIIVIPQAPARAQHPDKTGDFPRKKSKFQPHVDMAALGARRGLRPDLLRVEVIAADAVKTDFPARGIIECAITPVIIDP